MTTDTLPPVINPTMDVGELLTEVIADTATCDVVPGGYRVRVHHLGSFPWDAVFKALLFRDYKVFVARQKADVLIEAQR
jgi:hypothetical protein